MCWRSLQCLIKTDIQVFHCEILPQRCGATGRDPSRPQIRPQQLADGGWRGKSSLKRRGEPQWGWVGRAGGVKTTPGKQGVNKLCWQPNIPQIHTRACIQNRRVYSGTAKEAAVSDFKVTRPRGEPRNYYLIIFKGNLQSQYLWLQAQLNEPKKSVNGSLFTSGIRFHRKRGCDREGT